MLIIFNHMKVILFLFLLFCTVCVSAQTTVNAKFTFFSNKDSIDMNDPKVRLTGDLSFKLETRRTIKQVRYKVIVGTAAGKVLGSEESVTSDGRIYWSMGLIMRARPGDKLSVEILEMTDDQGAKFRPSKKDFRFTFK